MKIFRRILLILTLIIFTILVISSIYLKNGYEIYFNLGFIKLGNSNRNIIYILSGLILLIWAIYFLIKQIITKHGIIISISLFFTIFLLPFVFLISCGMNRNHSFTYKTESNKDILIMGYGKNTDTINMKYVFYERPHFIDYIFQINYNKFRRINQASTAARRRLSSIAGQPHHLLTEQKSTLPPCPGRGARRRNGGFL